MQRANSDDYRPVWLLAFYDQAELHSLALSAHLALGDYPTAEFHAHRCLAALRPHMRRSRAITMTRLAHAQLAQDDLETATTTAMKVPADAATQHARVSRMLQEFGAALRAKAPKSDAAQAWTEHPRRLEGRRMTSAPTTELCTHTDLGPIRGDILGTYAEVRAPLLHLPNYAVTAFGARLDRHSTEPGFVAVLAYAEGPGRVRLRQPH